jgi:hypothetical protein
MSKINSKKDYNKLKFKKAYYFIYTIINRHIK